MTVLKGTGFYHIEAANTNRQVSFAFQAIAGGVGVANAFLLLKGNNAFHPWPGNINAPTTNQLIAQSRVDYLTRYVSIYAIAVGIAVTTGTANTPATADTLVITYETYVSSVFSVSGGVNDIVDLLGKADRPAKTKSGLQTLATACVANASLDGGGTLLFALNPNLSTGTVSTAPAITSIIATELTPAYVY